jgi:two-component system OmpR family sensor kinase
MKTQAAKVSSKLITSHMYGEKINIDEVLTQDKSLWISAYGKDGKKLYGKDKEKLNLKNTTYMFDNLTVLIDEGPLGHYNIYYLKVIDSMFVDKVNKLKIETIGIFLIIYLLIITLGYYLIRLFMLPIQNERKRLDNFIKDTTHELNTPITAIMMCAHKDKLQNAKNIERIYISAKRLSDIYKDLIYLFLDNKKNEVKEINILTIINTQLEYFTLIADKKHISIDLELSDTIINIEEEDINRIISNILSNAIKYNKRGGSIHISLQNNILSIKDTGIGIEEENLKKIFTRYYRATKESGGFGMGLNIVKQICDKYNIKIEVFSQYKVYTTFKLDFN